jgi:hypothetical protein
MSEIEMMYYQIYGVKLPEQIIWVIYLTTFIVAGGLLALHIVATVKVSKYGGSGVGYFFLGWIYIACSNVAYTWNSFEKLIAILVAIFTDGLGLDIYIIGVLNERNQRNYNYSQNPVYLYGKHSSWNNGQNGWNNGNLNNWNNGQNGWNNGNQNNWNNGQNGWNNANQNGWNNVPNGWNNAPQNNMNNQNQNGWSNAGANAGSNTAQPANEAQSKENSEENK